jgi:hypothetical protein
LLFAGVVIAALLALIGHFVLFLTTGIGITPEYLRNWLRNPSEVNKMILSEVRPLHAVLLLLQNGLVVFFLFMPGLRPIKRFAARVTPELKKRAVAALALFFILHNPRMRDPASAPRECQSGHKPAAGGRACARIPA